MQRWRGTRKEQMNKILAAVGGATVAVSMAACGGRNPVAATTGDNNGVTRSAVSALGAHFRGSVTADQFACWNHQVSRLARRAVRAAT
jgi:hypothetical protein